MNPLGAPVQVAYGVDDVERAANRFSANTGAGPFFIVRHIALEAARVHGVAGSFDHSSAYGQWGSVMVELVQEHTPPLVPLDGSAQRIHHLAFLVPDLGAACDQCVARGWPEVLWARTGGGQQFAVRMENPERSARGGRFRWKAGGGAEAGLSLVEVAGGAGHRPGDEAARARGPLLLAPMDQHMDLQPRVDRRDRIADAPPRRQAAARAAGGTGENDTPTHA